MAVTGSASPVRYRILTEGGLERMTDVSVIVTLLIYGGAVASIVGGMLLLSFLLGERHRGRVTGEPYESGIAPTGSARIRFSAHYYVIAMFFVIFDLEAVFIVSWSIAFRESGFNGYVGALIFIGVLAAALVYEWRVGALDFAPRGKIILKHLARERERHHG